ncbi:MAG: hypothetical protein INF79_09795 [Roseomonas sp.]|nr:hypothetical protein [Roseomonas sp.]MCA3331669.1 hypothetical protein [Roseomonas sp.]MCA3333246.1 hypothetical protein [Roseomonas sp.]MCA3365892.1 hypothetical protein [Roseomonas sp.]MCA3373736.1 hypothetical protein [Roseomonas sp.]
MEGPIDMAIDKALLDQLFAGRKPQEPFAKNGLIDELKRTISAWMLIVQSLLPVPGSSMDRPAKRATSGARGHSGAGKISINCTTGA